MKENVNLIGKILTNRCRENKHKICKILENAPYPLWLFFEEYYYIHKNSSANQGGDKKKILWRNVIKHFEDQYYVNIFNEWHNQYERHEANQKVMKKIMTPEGHSDDVESVAFSPDGKRVVSGG
jgi:WD40 repeat protein